MNPCSSPSPCTVGALRTTDDRTPCSARAIAAFSAAIRGTVGSDTTSSSVPSRPSLASEGNEADQIIAIVAAQLAERYPDWDASEPWRVATAVQTFLAQ